jgi:hypothetical protein
VCLPVCHSPSDLGWPLALVEERPRLPVEEQERLHTKLTSGTVPGMKDCTWGLKAIRASSEMHVNNPVLCTEGLVLLSAPSPYPNSSVASVLHLPILANEDDSPAGVDLQATELADRRPANLERNQAKLSLDDFA